MSKRTALRRFCALVIVLAGFMLVAPPALIGAFPSAIAAAQVTPLDDEPDEAPNLGRITGSPDPGPVAEDAGDRGGAAQLTLALVLFLGLVFIGYRIKAEVTRNRSSSPPRTS